jgi:hypothetical protein
MVERRSHHGDARPAGRGIGERQQDRRHHLNQHRLLAAEMLIESGAADPGGGNQFRRPDLIIASF